MAGDSSHPSRFAFIEFDTQEAAQQALSMSGTMLLDRPLKYANSHAIHTIQPVRSVATNRQSTESTTQRTRL
jgi:hypothetical protein